MLDIESITNTIINDDCMNVLKQLPDKCIDLVVTSPPYDNLRTYNDSLDWNFEIFQKIAKELKRVVKIGGVIVWVISDQTINGSESGTSFKQALYFKEIGFNLHDTMIWEKKQSGSIGSMNRYEQTFEYMFVFSKGKPKTVNLICDKQNKHKNVLQYGSMRNPDGRTVKSGNYKKKLVNEYGRRHNVWNINPVMSNTQRIHPAMFPIELAQDHIKSWSNENDLILDCFSGSGTTAVACHNLKRRFICIEKDYDYWKGSVERLENAQAQMRLF